VVSRPRPDLSPEVVFLFDNLPSFTRKEVLLWNWFCRAAPSGKDWRAWVAEIFGHLLERPVGYQVRLIQTHLVDAQFGEKTLEFGAKQEISLGRQKDADVVLSAPAIASKHARLFAEDGHFYLEDQGGQLGTYLWDKKIAAREKQLVRSGDQFTVFPYRFRLALDPRWAPGANVTIGTSRVRLQSRGEFYAQSPPGMDSFILDTHPSGERALVDVSPAFLEGLRQRIFGPLGLRAVEHSVPSDETFLSFILFAILERMNQKLKFPERFSFVRGSRNIGLPSTRGLQVNFAMRVDDLAGDLALFLPFGFLSAHEVSTPEPVAEGLGQLCWTFPVTAGFVDLSVDEMSQIGLGDIVVAQPFPGILFPRDFGRGWSMTADGSNFVRFKIDKYIEGGSSLPEGTDATASAGKAPIGTLPVRLHVVLAEKEFTLAEVQSFSPGAVIELDANKQEPVRLMVNGRILGDGELVEVEGNLAVRVLNWRDGS
jgi:flagellar motor switch/type III secretory pathway protein FliN